MGLYAELQNILEVAFFNPFLILFVVFILLYANMQRCGEEQKIRSAFSEEQEALVVK